MEFEGEFCPRLNIKIDMLLLLAICGSYSEGILLFNRLYANEDFCVLSKVDV
jgi:hypothetical protein